MLSAGEATLICRAMGEVADVYTRTWHCRNKRKPAMGKGIGNLALLLCMSFTDFPFFLLLHINLLAH
jgi:hypothetical protein